ncbi:lysophospholipid acyltransferase family protein [Pontibacter sp. SGAir0037]|uniref:lysophospholipid acyltransferase family protein n=1 Tax=Pontibacter sp. SGAir0037 TaxID=2571030 RepID=UPI0010CCFCA8|nr:GNAT family N-acyltransferase [Pontibacter sp. SGAir0037]QCR23131.1 hemolysin [Pontibacter sp. SGAir0037]
MEIITKQQFSAAAALDKVKFHFLSSVLMQILKIKDLNMLYDTIHTLDGVAFIDGVLKELDIKIDIHPHDLKNIPQQGAFIAVANHPYGALDGLIMMSLLAKARPDFKMMANQLLMRVPNLQELLIPVNPFREQNKGSVAGLRESLKQLHNDMPIGVFPAGEVASFKFSSSSVADPEWHSSIERLIHRAKVPVLPIYFSGGNSLAFNVLGLLHPLLRTAQLPAQLINKQGKTVKVRIGKPISYNELHAFPEQELLRYVRAKTYMLGTSFQQEQLPVLQRLKKYAAPEAVIAETPAAVIARELDALDKSALLVKYNHLEVYLAKQEAVPHVVREIGRLREITFRAVGEGTNKAIDLDKYDEYYHHLFIYDRKAQLLVGAYRLGKGNSIYKKYGKKGFYLHSLFKMSGKMAPTLKVSLELGRSFVRQEYQRQPLPLLLLWKGISAFLEKKQSYRYLIGPVSISNLFSSASKMLMVDFITTHFYDLELAKHVRARKQFRYRFSKEQYEQVVKNQVSSIETLEKLIADIDPAHATLPVLLKKYLKQNARIISFNIDPKFSNSLDGFMVMDVSTLPATTSRMLERYATEQKGEA